MALSLLSDLTNMGTEFRIAEDGAHFSKNGAFVPMLFVIPLVAYLGCS
jgi:hypothetical protein